MSGFKDTDHRAGAPAPGGARSTAPANAPDAVKVDGFGQVIALLEIADPAFRESLIARVAAKDPHLARQIRATLARTGHS